MFALTNDQFKKCCYNFRHNELFDPVLLDDRDELSNIVTVVKYDDETILLQRVDKNGWTYNKVSNKDFLKRKGVIVR